MQLKQRIEELERRDRNDDVLNPKMNHQHRPSLHTTQLIINLNKKITELEDKVKKQSNEYKDLQRKYFNLEGRFQAVKNQQGEFQIPFRVPPPPPSSKTTDRRRMSSMF